MILDIIALVVLLISAGIAFMRGFIREVLTIAGVTGGLAAAYFGGPVLTPHMQGWLGVEEGVEPERLFGAVSYDLLGMVLSYALIFILVVIILSVISHFLAEGAKAIGLGAVDRTFGFIFGVIRGALLLGLLYLPVHLYAQEATKEDWFSGSKTHIYIEKTSGFIASFLPDNAQDGAKATIEKAEDIIDVKDSLKNIDVLKTDNLQEQLQKIDALTQGEKVQLDNITPVEGYSDEFRDDMTDLIEEKSRSLNE